MNHKIEKNIRFLLPVIFLALASCSFNPSQNRQVIVEKEVNFNKKFDIQLKINNLNNLFKTKATNTSVDGQAAKAFLDIKSFSAFLTTDPVDPFALGANPNGNGFMINRDNTDTSGPVTINFHNVPRGGQPYYAVIAAFDGLSGDTNRKNITKINTNLASSDQKWTISQNNVTISSSGNLTFSDDPNNTLVADLNLQDGIANRISFQVDLIDGNTAYSGAVGTNGQF
jgi:hypothetical protein